MRLGATAKQRPLRRGSLQEHSRCRRGWKEAQMASTRGGQGLAHLDTAQGLVGAPAQVKRQARAWQAGWSAWPAGVLGSLGPTHKAQPAPHTRLPLCTHTPGHGLARIESHWHSWTLEPPQGLFLGLGKRFSVRPRVKTGLQHHTRQRSAALTQTLPIAAVPTHRGGSTPRV